MQFLYLSFCSVFLLIFRSASVSLTRKASLPLFRSASLILFHFVILTLICSINQFLLHSVSLSFFHFVSLSLSFIVYLLPSFSISVIFLSDHQYVSLLSAQLFCPSYAQFLSPYTSAQYFFLSLFLDTATLFLFRTVFLCVLPSLSMLCPS